MPPCAPMCTHMPPCAPMCPHVPPCAPMHLGLHKVFPVTSPSSFRYLCIKFILHPSPPSPPLSFRSVWLWTRLLATSSQWLHRCEQMFWGGNSGYRNGSTFARSAFVRSTSFISAFVRSKFVGSAFRGRDVPALVGRQGAYPYPCAVTLAVVKRRWLRRFIHSHGTRFNHVTHMGRTDHVGRINHVTTHMGPPPGSHEPQPLP